MAITFPKSSAVHHVAHPPRSEATIVKDTLKHVYDANKFPFKPGAVTVPGGGKIQMTDFDKLPKDTAAFKAIDKVMQEGVDGDQLSYKLTIGKKDYLVVASFPEDASRDQVWIWDAKGNKPVAYGTPNDDGKLVWGKTQ
jgi:hypothetical protein